MITIHNNDNDNNDDTDNDRCVGNYRIAEQPAW